MNTLTGYEQIRSIVAALVGDMDSAKWNLNCQRQAYAVLVLPAGIAAAAEFKWRNHLIQVAPLSKWNQRLQIHVVVKVGIKATVHASQAQ
ncbi:hypothetical protein BK133_12555 [Paenibacillus sp. FSL H8-0548]|uniref:hypothetical protein n=1 Tax=Paenibacillus sp. FSL H8-0548 TaxID=1920422 RepID=UPI00096FE004|nr:hypothetical protein [Paenibacillus sp. FSL H8-0548]OMF34615.1 hypothetical protein BK133_12555 [Paenibacillus sp. FSL H8-0548]